MTQRRIPLAFTAAFVATLTCLAIGGVARAASQEIKGAAILDHACGKVAVKHMGLVHAGKMDEAVLLGTPEMQQQWKAMPADDRKMMSGMMKEMSQTSEAFAADIKTYGVLTVDGAKATLAVKRVQKDANGSSTETTTQSYAIDAKGCWIAH